MSDDITKLIEIASKPLKEPIKQVDKESSVFKFIQDLKIKSHPTITVRYSVIYFRYITWCRTNNIKPYGASKFSIYFNKKFDKKATRQETGYYINPEGFDLSAANIQLADETLKGLRNGKTKTKKESKAKRPKSDNESQNES